MRTAVYVRVSTEEQVEKGSIATQRDFAQHYCEREKIEIAGFYADDGVSGTVPLEQRPEGARLLADARAKKFDAVLVYKLDRLGRDPRLLLNAINELETAGTELRSMTEGFDATSPAGRFMRTILSGVAGLERDNIVQRSMAGTARVVRSGAWVGGRPPYGYRVKRNRARFELVVSDVVATGRLTEADVVRLAFRLCADEGRSCIAIAEHLNSLEFPPPAARSFEDGETRRAGLNRGWHPSTVRKLLASSTYMGLHRYGKRSKRGAEIIGRAVPSIVSRDTWDRAQSTLKRNMLFSMRNAHRKYLLRGIIKCGHCGHTCVGKAHPRRNDPFHAYYICNAKHTARRVFGKAGRCPSSVIPWQIEDAVWHDIEGFVRNPGAVLDQLVARAGEIAKQTKTTRDEISDLQDVVAKKEEERNTILGLFRRGRIDEKALDRQMDEIEQERGALAERLEELEQASNQRGRASAQLSDAGALLRRLCDQISADLSWEMKRKLIETLVESVDATTVELDGRKDVSVAVTYRFAVNSEPIAKCTPRAAPRTRGAARRLRALRGGCSPPAPP